MQSKTGLKHAKDAVWVPVAVSAVAVALNAISKSAGERRIWVPVAAALLISSLIVALR